MMNLEKKIAQCQESDYKKSSENLIILHNIIANALLTEKNIPKFLKILRRKNRFIYKEKALHFNFLEFIKAQSKRILKFIDLTEKCKDLKQEAITIIENSSRNIKNFIKYKAYEKIR